MWQEQGGEEFCRNGPRMWKIVVGAGAGIGTVRAAAVGMGNVVGTRIKMSRLCGVEIMTKFEKQGGNKNIFVSPCHSLFILSCILY